MSHPLSGRKLERREARARGVEFSMANAFVQMLNGLNPDAREAWILYLADRYLGMKPRDWTWTR